MWGGVYGGGKNRLEIFVVVLVGGNEGINGEVE